MADGYSVRRIAEAFGRDTGDALKVLYGVGTIDRFVGDDYLIHSLEEALYEQLRQRGFERVAFSQLNQPLYFVDSESHRRSVEVREPATSTGSPTTHCFRSGGPFGTRAGFLPFDRPRPQPAQVSSAAASGVVMLDPFLMRVLQQYMRDDTVRTAIVIISASDYLSHLSEQRALAENLAEWLRAGIRNGNRCVLVFNEPTLESVIDAVGRADSPSALRSFFERQRQLHEATSVRAVLSPDQEELRRLIVVMRLRHQLTVDHRTIRQTVTAMAGQRTLTVNNWYAALSHLSQTRTTLAPKALVGPGMLESVPDTRNAMERLNGYVGLSSILVHLKRLRANAEIDHDLRRRGVPTEPSSLHLVFTGNPGTGKTTVAGFIGELYREIGLLQSGHLEAVSGPQLIGQYIGQTTRLVNEAIDRALGGVLLIDEAYQLAAVPHYGAEAINQLVQRIDQERNRLVVILAGYPDNIAGLLQENPGLPRRFPEDNRIAFPDYEPEALLEILLRMLGARGCAWDPDELEPALREVTKRMHRSAGPDFGNAGAMRNLAEAIKRRWALRVAPDSTRPVLAQDIPSNHRPKGLEDRVDHHGR